MDTVLEIIQGENYWEINTVAALAHIEYASITKLLEGDSYWEMDTVLEIVRYTKIMVRILVYYLK
jgi:hypothetical protein